jgi:predicted GTPase
VLSKVNTATAENVEAVRAAALRLNPDATVVEVNLALSVDAPERLEGARVLVVEDGPTTTHGGMRYGAGAVAAKEHGAKELVDPRPAAVGSLRETFEHYGHLTEVLPAMGYGETQVRELEATIAGTDCDAVVIATPVDLSRVMNIRQPTVRVTYDTTDRSSPTLPEALGPFIAKAKRG